MYFIHKKFITLTSLIHKIKYYVQQSNPHTQIITPHLAQRRQVKNTPSCFASLVPILHTAIIFAHRVLGHEICWGDSPVISTLSASFPCSWDARSHLHLWCYNDKPITADAVLLSHLTWISWRSHIWNRWVKSMSPSELLWNIMPAKWLCNAPYFLACLNTLHILLFL